jgi:small-conductance mechanosensitive channel
MKMRVEGNERLVRDSSNLAILNTDKSIVSAHEQKIRQLKKLKSQESEINTLKSDVSEIKQMLSQLLQQRNNQ